MEDVRGIRFPPVVGAIYEESRREGFDLVSEPLAGCLLRTLVASKRAGRFLELGTGTGAATAWILDGMDPRSSLVTVESDEHLVSIARRHLGADSRVTFVQADGDAFLRGAAGSAFDLIFADTWPGKYENLESALDLLERGGLYVVDDMDPQATWPAGHHARVAALLQHLIGRPDLHVTKLSWASGIVIAARV